MQMSTNEWFSHRHKWLQVAAKRLIEADTVNEQAISELATLCHQPLSEEAKQRFITFGSYIRGKTQKQATDTARDVKQAIDALPDIPSAEALKTKIDAAGIENQEIIKALNDTLTTLQDRKTKVPLLDSEDALGSANQSPEWIEEIRKISQGYEDSAKKYEEDAENDNRAELQAKLKNLQAKKWLAEQKTAIQEEVNRLQALDRFQEAKKKTNSRALSTKKGELAEALIADAFVQRLCSIASERQVIIFTHRLSLLAMVQDYAKKVSIKPEIICIREEPWGTGEPGRTPLQAQKPLQALNTLINSELPKAKKLFNENGFDAYKTEAKSLCSEFRILLERMVEYELMSDVVQRYRRAINTMGKIGNLAKISESDCKYFDDLMTKYSRYEHSQPLEAPVQLPAPDELETDFNELKNWQAEFKKRPLTPALQEGQ